MILTHCYVARPVRFGPKTERTQECGWKDGGRGNSFFAGMDLRICAGELCLLFAELKWLSPRIKFHQNIPSLHFLVERQMGRHDSAAHGGFNGMRRPIYLQVRLIRLRTPTLAREKTKSSMPLARRTPVRDPGKNAESCRHRENEQIEKK